MPVARNWWRGAVGYEIYIRSFLDSDGDGVGDLAGITSKLEVLDHLGVDVVWITPFYPSPGKDQGYDVSNYVDIDPCFGTLDDFDRLVARATELGMRVFVDIVPNHTSDEHPWFQAAIADIDSPYRNYYLFRPAAPDGGPPNNWVSHFGGPAWTLDPAGTGEYYCHLFLPEQPDLNWANPAVMDEFQSILIFWCERGVDGFRIDVAHGLTKDPQFRDNQQVRPVTPGMHPKDVFASYQHTHDLHRPETTKIFEQWRSVVTPYDAVLIGEMDVRNIERFTEYVSGDGLDSGFVLKLSASHWEPATLLSDLLTYERAAHGGAAWAVSNHDQPRAVSRFGGGEIGVRRAAALTTLMVALHGITFLYHGDELGLPDAVLTGVAMDPVSTRNDGAAGRDVARGPIPWDATPGQGFTSAKTAWLQTAPVEASLTAAAQIGVPGSTWERYRAMLDLRRRLPALWMEPFHIFDRQATSLVIFRGPLTIIANFDDKAFEFVPEGEFQIEFESQAGAAGGDGGHLRIEPESTVVLSRHEPGHERAGG